MVSAVNNYTSFGSKVYLPSYKNHFEQERGSLSDLSLDEQKKYVEPIEKLKYNGKDDVVQINIEYPYDSPEKLALSVSELRNGEKYMGYAEAKGVNSIYIAELYSRAKENMVAAESAPLSKYLI